MIRKVDKRGYPGRNLGHLVKDFKQERRMTDYPQAAFGRGRGARAV
jgi:hypothetical protein